MSYVTCPKNLHLKRKEEGSVLAIVQCWAASRHSPLRQYLLFLPMAQAEHSSGVPLLSRQLYGWNWGLSWGVQELQHVQRYVTRIMECPSRGPG